MSRLIKPIWSNSDQLEKKVIAIKMVGIPETAVNDFGVEQHNKTSVELLNEATQEAEQIIGQAKLKYDNLRAKIQEERDSWIQEKEVLVNAAKEEGYQEGWEEGRQQGYSEYQMLIKEAQQIIIASKNDYTAYVDSSEKTILDLAVKIAEKILAHKIEDGINFVSLVKRALKETKEYHDIRLHVHPQNYEYVLSQKEELLAVFSHETNLFIYPDEDLPNEGCIIESEIGRIDASVDTQLSEIKQILTEILESETS